jgi:hypothetical protein
LRVNEEVGFPQALKEGGGGGLLIHLAPEHRQLAQFQIVGHQGGFARTAGRGDPDQGAFQAGVEPGM